MSFLRRFAFLNPRKSKRWMGNKKKKYKVLQVNPYTGKRLRAQNMRNLPGVVQITFSSKGANSAWFGADMREPPDKSDARLAFMNCNGLAYSDMNFFKSFLTQIKQCHTHYYGLAEININSCNTDLVQRMMCAVDEAIPGGSFQLRNTSIFDRAVEYQPGGVASGFQGRISKYYGGSKMDELGRWCCDEFKGPLKSVKIYTLYRVNPKPSNVGGGCTAWEQQQLALRAQNINIDPRHYVIDSLIPVISEDITKGFSIILMSDLNEGVQDRERTNDRFSSIGLENLFHRAYTVVPPTYARGQKTIDHIWMTF